jgi:arginase
MHGMPVSFLMGLVDQPKKLPGFEWFKPCLDVKDLVYIGLRDLDQDEKDTIKRLGIKAYTVSLLLLQRACNLRDLHN